MPCSPLPASVLSARGGTSPGARLLDAKRRGWGCQRAPEAAPRFRGFGLESGAPPPAANKMERVMGLEPTTTTLATSCSTTELHPLRGRPKCPSAPHTRASAGRKPRAQGAPEIGILETSRSHCQEEDPPAGHRSSARGQPRFFSMRTTFPRPEYSRRSEHLCMSRMPSPPRPPARIRAFARSNASWLSICER